MFAVTTSHSFLPKLSAYNGVHLQFATHTQAKRAASALAKLGIVTYCYCINPAPIPCP
jgi:hypothetical protein